MATRTVIHPHAPGVLALRTHIARIHHSVVDDVFADARDHAPVDTGWLRRSIHVRHLGTVISLMFRPLRSHVVVNTAHWMPMEYGASPHTIRPKNKKALFWPGAPHPVTVVHHPGNDAQPFMRPACYKRRSLAGRP